MAARIFNSAVRYSVCHKKSRIEGRKSATLPNIVDYIQLYIVHLLNLQEVR